MRGLMGAPEVIGRYQPFLGLADEGSESEFLSRNEDQRVIIEVPREHRVERQFARGMQVQGVTVLAVDLLDAKCLAEYVLDAGSGGLLDVQKHQSVSVVVAFWVRPRPLFGEKFAVFARVADRRYECRQVSMQSEAIGMRQQALLVRLSREQAAIDGRDHLLGLEPKQVPPVLVRFRDRG